MISFQITKPDSEASMEFRLTGWTRVLWAGTTGNR